MPLGSSAELDVMLQDAGVPVVYNGVTVYGLLDVVELDELTPQGIRAAERDTKVSIRDGALASLVEDAPITVDGASYTIRGVGPKHADGLRPLRLVPTVTG